MSKNTFVIDWVSTEEQRPPPCTGILFTDGGEVYFGWLETWDAEELPSWYDCEGREYIWPDNITHWAIKPLPPEVKERKVNLPSG